MTAPRQILLKEFFDEDGCLPDTAALEPGGLFQVDEEEGVVIVLAVWGAPRRRVAAARGCGAPRACYAPNVRVEVRARAAARYRRASRAGEERPWSST
jgi:hypothetical protein